MVWSMLRASTRPKAEYSILIKIMTNYLQLVTLVVGFNLRWPQKVEDAFTAQNSVGGTSEQFFSFDCLIGSHVSQEQTYYRKMIIMAVMPLLLIAVSLLFWTFLAWRKKKWVFLTRECAATIIIIFFLIPNLVDSMFSLFSCQEIEAGEYHFTLQQSTGATLKTSLPSQFLRQAKRYVPRVSAVVVSMTTQRLEARRMSSESP